MLTLILISSSLLAARLRFARMLFSLFIIKQQVDQKNKIMKACTGPTASIPFPRILLYHLRLSP